MAQSSLQAIRSKVRQITRSPDPIALTDTQLDEFINTFVLQDFPEHVRLFNLLTVLEFWTTPFVAKYDTRTAPATDPLFDFKNKYITVQGPLYVAGVQGQIIQSRAQFFSMYPQVQSQQRIGTGDGATLTFTGTISGQPILQESVTVSSADASGVALLLRDYPQAIDVGTIVGALGVPDQPQAIPSPFGQVNYRNGQITVNFPTAPAQDAPIIVNYFAYQASRPLVCLYYDGVFEFRPVPAQSYKITMSAFIRPTELLQSNQSPELNEWWQFIAWGASKKVFENRMDLESIQELQPLLEEQMRLIERRTLVQNSTQRTPTIYQYANNNMGFPGGYFFNQF